MFSLEWRAGVSSPSLRVLLARFSALILTIALFPASLVAAEGASGAAANVSDAAAEENGGQSYDVPPAGVEVLRVRGRGIGQVQVEVPEAVTGFDAATIDALGAQDVSDLSRVTPNVNIVQPNASQAVFFIRGIGLSDFQSNATSAVAIFQDDVALNAAAIQTEQLFDIESVEISKGPRGSGPFRNATAGAIQVRSRRPTGVFGGKMRATIGQYAAEGGRGAERAPIQDYEGAVEFPVVDELLAARFAFRLREADPFKSNGCGNAPPFDQRARVGRGANRNEAAAAVCNERDRELLPNNSVSKIPVGLSEELQSEHNWAARGTVTIRPRSSETEVVLNAHGSRMDQDPIVGQAIGSFSVNPGDPTATFRFGGRSAKGYQDPDQREEFEALCQRSGASCTTLFPADHLAARLAQGRPLDRRPYRGDYNREGQLTRDAWGSFAILETAIGGTSIFGLASYNTYERFQETDLDFTSDVLFEQVEEDRAWQTYEEIRIGGELRSQPFTWELGGYFFSEMLEVNSALFLGVENSITQPTIIREYSQETTSFGIWSSFVWEFYDDLTLEGGVRYNWEQKLFELTRRDLLRNITIRPASSRQTQVWATPTGEIILRYHVDVETSAYLKYTRGFKAGHFNAFPGLQQVDSPPADEEYNDAWEIGIKGRWFDARLNLAASFFYYRYQNYQLFNLRDDPASPPVLEILNANEAENYGIELEVKAEPLRGWAPRRIEDLEITGNFAWLHGEYIDFLLIEPEDFPGGAVLPITNDFSGNQLQNSPKYSFSLSAEWTLDFGRWGHVIPRYDVNWSDDVFFNIREGRGLRFADGTHQLPKFAVGQPAMVLHNLRLRYRTPTGIVEVAAWVRNLQDRTFKTFAADVSKFRGVVVNFVGEPRTMGFDLTVSF